MSTLEHAMGTAGDFIALRRKLRPCFDIMFLIYEGHQVHTFYIFSIDRRVFLYVVIICLKLKCSYFILIRLVIDFSEENIKQSNNM